MRFFYSLIFIFFMGTVGYCSEPLKVGVVVNPPFVIKNNLSYTGIAVDLWNEIAQGLGRPYTFVECSNLENAFESLQKGNLDVLAGSIPTTLDHHQKGEFSLPFFIDKIIAVTPSNYIHNAFLALKTFLFSAGGGIAIFILFFIVYLNLLWYYESPYTSSFPKDYKEGMFQLFWLHLLSGRYTEIPKSLPARLLVLFHKYFYYFIFIIINATIVSFVTISFVKYATPIQSISDLEKEKVGAVKNTKRFKVGTYMGLRVVPYDSIEEGIKALEEGQIAAFLEDFSTAEDYIKENAQANLKVSPFELKHDLYVFATQIGSPLLREIDTQILKLRIEEIPQKICKLYLPRSSINCDF